GGGIGILALLVWRLGEVRLARREWAGVGLAISGLVLLAVSLARTGTSHPFAAHASWLGVAAWMAVTGVLAAAFAGPFSRLLAGSLLCGRRRRDESGRRRRRAPALRPAGAHGARARVRLSRCCSSRTGACFRASRSGSAA